MDSQNIRDLLDKVDAEEALEKDKKVVLNRRTVIQVIEKSQKICY